MFVVCCLFWAKIVHSFWWIDGTLRHSHRHLPNCLPPRLSKQCSQSISCCFQLPHHTNIRLRFAFYQRRRGNEKFFAFILTHKSFPVEAFRKIHESFCFFRFCCSCKWTMDEVKGSRTRTKLGQRRDDPEDWLREWIVSWMRIILCSCGMFSDLFSLISLDLWRRRGIIAVSTTQFSTTGQCREANSILTNEIQLGGKPSKEFSSILNSMKFF